MKFGDDAKVGWTEADMSKVLKDGGGVDMPTDPTEIIKRMISMLRYGRPMHLGPMIEFFVPLGVLVQNLISLLPEEESISMESVAAMAYNEKDRKSGEYIFELASLVVKEGEEPEELQMYIRANEKAAPQMGLDPTGKITSSRRPPKEDEWQEAPRKAKEGGKRTWNQRDEQQQDPWQEAAKQQRGHSGWEDKSGWKSSSSKW